MPHPYWNNYQQFMGYPNAQYQPLYQPQQPTIQTNMIWVSGIDEVKAYPTAPNTVIPFWDNDGKTEYWKQTDASGRASIRVFDRIDRTSQKENPKETPELATKQDIVGIATILQNIIYLLNGGKNDVQPNANSATSSTDQPNASTN